MRLKVLEQLRFDEISKQTQQDLASAIIQEAVGNFDVRESYVKIDFLIKALTDAKDGLKPSFNEQIEDEPIVTPTIEVKKQERKTYKFDKDSEYRELSTQSETIKTIIKNREKILKQAAMKAQTAPDAKTFDPTTGEEIPVVDYEVKEIIQISYK